MVDDDERVKEVEFDLTNAYLRDDLAVGALDMIEEKFDKAGIFVTFA